MAIFNINNLPNDCIWEDEIGLITKSLGGAAGSQKLYINIDIVPPKAYSTKYHSHSQQEEFFIVLGGTGTLRLHEEEHPVKKGDFFAKLPAPDMAHTFYNSGEEPLLILDVGTKEPEDTCYYPDEQVYLHKCGEQRRVYSEAGLLQEWSSDPNQKKRNRNAVIPITIPAFS